MAKAETRAVRAKAPTSGACNTVNLDTTLYDEPERSGSSESGRSHSLSDHSHSQGVHPSYMRARLSPPVAARSSAPTCCSTVRPRRCAPSAASCFAAAVPLTPVPPPPTTSAAQPLDGDAAALSWSCGGACGAAGRPRRGSRSVSRPASLSVNRRSAADAAARRARLSRAGCRCCGRGGAAAAVEGQASVASPSASSAGCLGVEAAAGASALDVVAPSAAADVLPAAVQGQRFPDFPAHVVIIATHVDFGSQLPASPQPKAFESGNSQRPRFHNLTPAHLPHQCLGRAPAVLRPPTRRRWMSALAAPPAALRQPPPPPPLSAPDDR